MTPGRARYVVPCLPGVLLLLCGSVAVARAQAPREAVLYRLGAVGCAQREAAQATEALGAALAAQTYFDALWQFPDSETDGAHVLCSRDPLNAFPALPDRRVLLRLTGAVVLSPEGGRYIQLIARRSPPDSSSPDAQDPQLPAALGLGLPVAWEAEAPVPVERLLSECARAMGPVARIKATRRLGSELLADLEPWAPLPAGRYAVCRALGAGRRVCLTRTVGVVTLGGQAGGWRPAAALGGQLHRGLYLALLTPLPLRWPSLSVPTTLQSDPPLAAVSLHGRFLGLTPCLCAVPAGARTVEVSRLDGPAVLCRLPSAPSAGRSVQLGAGALRGGPGPEPVAAFAGEVGPLAAALNLPVEPAPPPPGGAKPRPAAVPHAELPPGALWPSYPPPDRIAALTFDDYPSEGLSGHLLTVLRDSEVKATLFVIGRKAARMPYLLRQAVAEGHVLGNHTYDHKRLGQASWGEIHRQITRCSEVVRRITGAGTRYFRPPGGQTSDTLRAVLPTVGMRLVMWDAATPDYSNPPPEQIVADILTNSRGHSRLIINLHDGHPATIQALPELIHQLRLRGYRFVTMDEFTNGG